MHFGALIIGDELLSGKRQDKHLSHVIETLRRRGQPLSWCRMIGDEPALIVETLKQTMATTDVVFCFGGIGATPDDHTRHCAAVAAGVPLVRHPQAVAEIEAQFGQNAYPKRILMAQLPQGSQIIPNPYNRIPGFTVGRHHFLPGFPQMAWPMMEWVLDQIYPELVRRIPEAESVLTVDDAVESELMDVMIDVVRAHPSVRLASLPHFGDGNERWVELSVKGTAPDVEQAIGDLRSQLSALGLRWRDNEGNGAPRGR